MSTYRTPRNGFRNSFSRALMVVAGGLLWFSGCVSAGAAERPSESEILKALRPPPVARSLSGTPAPKDVDRQNLVNRLRSSKSRSLTDNDRTELAAVAKERPSIDLEIYFDYNSAEITSKAVPDLMTLGRALTNSDLQGGVFLVGGHTDGKGGQDYNQRLSERRAQAVKDFLVSRFHIADDTLVGVGYGFEQLKNTANPYAAVNRRVQITNLETKQEAGK